MKLIITKGTTSKRIQIFIQDSSSTTGAGLTGLTNASSGLTWYYRREDAGNAGGTSVSVVSATLGTFTSGGFKEVDATNMPGWYELGVPNAVLASGADWATMHLKGVTNMAPVPIEIELTSFDLQTATPSVTVSDKTGFSLSSAGVQAIWDALTSALTTSGSIGKWIVDKLDVVLSTRLATSGYTAPDNTSITAIKAKTDNLPAAPASTGDVTTVGSAVAALNNISTTQVKAQVVAALNTDTYAEPTAPPAATATLTAKIGWLAILARNKLTQTDALQTLYADNGTTVVATADVSDDGTLATRSEFAA